MTGSTMSNAAPAAMGVSAPPAPGSGAGGGGVRRFTRDELIQLGQAGSPWAFVPLAEQALGVIGDDHGLRFLLAANLAKLLLRTAALEHLALLEEVAGEDASVRALAEAVSRLPADEIPAERRVDVCRANVAVLAGRDDPISAAAASALKGAFEAWAQRTAQERWFSARAGNIARLVPGEGAASDSPGGWRHLSDLRAAASGFAARHAGEGLRNGLVLEGVDPPWLLLEAHRVSSAVAGAGASTAGDGFSPRLRVVQADPMELLDGLACADLGEVLADPRVEVYVGEEACARLEEELRGRFDEQILSPHARSATLRTPAAPPVQEMVDRLGAEQAREQDELVQRVEARCAARDVAWWARRFGEAGGGLGGPKRMSRARMVFVC